MEINLKTPIPNTNSEFHRFIETFVFLCPAAIVTSKKKEKTKKFTNISARECSFRTRKITGTLLATITAQIKRQVEFYKKVGKDQTVEEVYNANISTEKIVFKENTQMSDAEAVFYYIRNAFAHGAFEFVSSTKMYKLESSKNGVIRAKMALKESTLKKIAKIAALDKNSVERLQKKH